MTGVDVTSLRCGFTTGTCASAAAKAAALVLEERVVGPEVEVGLPDGTRAVLSITRTERGEGWAEAAVRKDAGDDPDVTHGSEVVARVRPARADEPRGLCFEAGPGVGTVTRAGLAIPPGEPAINPVPRSQIAAAVREVTGADVVVRIGIPGGDALAVRTQNPRLGVVGGLSILGTSGRVRPYSCSACFESLRCAMRVARAAGVKEVVLVPGHIGERAARRHFDLDAVQVVELGNEWGRGVDLAREMGFRRVLVVGHPGKLAKLPAQEWDTHSSRSASAASRVRALAERVLGRGVPAAAAPSTVEEILEGLSAECRQAVGTALAEEIRAAVEARLGSPATIVLINLAGKVTATAGEVAPWGRL